MAPVPAVFNNTLHVFLARGVARVSDELDLDEGEDIRVELHPYPEVRRMVERGDILHAQVVAAFYLYELWREAHRPAVGGAGAEEDGVMKRLIVGISGASGTIYGVRLLEVLRHAAVEVHLVMSGSARRVVELETDYTLAEIEALADYVHDNDDIAAPISSGSFRTGRHDRRPLLDQEPLGHREQLQRHAAGSGGRCGLEGASEAGSGGARDSAAPQPSASDDPRDRVRRRDPAADAELLPSSPRPSTTS